jgi:arylsulfatase A-like enzyme
MLLRFITLVVISVAFPASLARAESSTEPTRRPNIVLILADDLGYGDVGCFGCRDIPTPNIDSLAKSGVRFIQAYAYPTCSPTRAALLTGNYAERFGITKALMGEDAPKMERATTVAELLHDAGYVTGLVGKWHLGYTDDVSPTHKGFDEFFGFRGGKIDYFNHTDTAQKIKGHPEGKHDLWEGERQVHMKGYSTNLFTTRAREFIRDHAGKSDEKPFFLYLAYNAPHYAEAGVWQAPQKYLKRFHAEGQTKGRGVYRAMVACLDDGVGEVLAEISAQKLDDRTLVIFMSDNGPDKPGSARPLSGGKFTYREGGVRVPWMARWPGVIPSGVVREDVVHATDFLPTMLAVAHVEAPKSLHVDGRNVWQAFVGGEPLRQRPVYFSDEGLRLGDWKLLGSKLFNLRDDQAEKTDLAKLHPELVQQMEQMSRGWAQSLAMGSPTTRPAEKSKKDGKPTAK